MSGADEVFSAFRDPDLAREGQARGRQEGFEEAIVKRLLRSGGVELRVGQAKQQSWEDFQTRSLTFDWFRQRYPQFPVNMGSSKLPFTSGTHIGWTDLFGSGFMKLPWVAEYIKLCHTMSWNVHTERVALCFNAPKLGTTVLHNQPIQAHNVVDPERRTEPETRILRPIGNPRVTYVIETISSFLDTVGTDWAGG